MKNGRKHAFPTDQLRQLLVVGIRLAVGLIETVISILAELRFMNEPNFKLPFVKDIAELEGTTISRDVNN